MHESNGRSTASAESRASERRGRDDSKSLTIPIPSSLQRGTWRFSAPLSHLDTAPPSTGASWELFSESQRNSGVNDLSHFVRDYKMLFDETPPRRVLASAELDRSIVASSRFRQ